MAKKGITPERIAQMETVINEWASKLEFGDKTRVKTGIDGEKTNIEMRSHTVGKNDTLDILAAATEMSTDDLKLVGKANELLGKATLMRISKESAESGKQASMSYVNPVTHSTMLMETLLNTTTKNPQTGETTEHPIRFKVVSHSQINTTASKAAKDFYLNAITETA